MGFREPFSIFFNSLAVFAHVCNFFYFFCLISVELHPNDQKLSKCSFGNLFWHQNYQTRFRFDPIYWTLPAHTLLFWWFWSQEKACKWCYNFLSGHLNIKLPPDVKNFKLWLNLSKRDGVACENSADYQCRFVHVFTYDSTIATLSSLETAIVIWCQNRVLGCNSGV